MGIENKISSEHLHLVASEIFKPTNQGT